MDPQSTAVDQPKALPILLSSSALAEALFSIFLEADRFPWLTATERRALSVKFAKATQVRELMRRLQPAEQRLIYDWFCLGSLSQPPKSELCVYLSITTVNFDRALHDACKEIFKMALAIDRAGSYEKSILALGFSCPLENRLLRGQVYSLAGLVKLSEGDLIAKWHFGHEAIDQIAGAIAAYMKPVSADS